MDQLPNTSLHDGNGHNKVQRRFRVVVNRIKDNTVGWFNSNYSVSPSGQTDEEKQRDLQVR